MHPHYSKLDNKEIKTRIEQLGNEKYIPDKETEDAYELFLEFLEWKKLKG